MVDRYYEDVLTYIKDFSARNRGDNPRLLAVMCHGDENENMKFLERSLPLQEIIGSIPDLDHAGFGKVIGQHQLSCVNGLHFPMYIRRTTYEVAEQPYCLGIERLGRERDI